MAERIRIDCEGCYKECYPLPLTTALDLLLPREQLAMLLNLQAVLVSCDVRNKIIVMRID